MIFDPGMNEMSIFGHNENGECHIIVQTEERGGGEQR